MSSASGAYFDRARWRHTSGRNTTRVLSKLTMSSVTTTIITFRSIRIVSSTIVVLDMLMDNYFFTTPAIFAYFNFSSDNISIRSSMNRSFFESTLFFAFPATAADDTEYTNASNNEECDYTLKLFSSCCILAFTVINMTRSILFL